MFGKVICDKIIISRPNNGAEHHAGAHSYLSQLLDFGTFHSNDAPCQALMDQQAQLAVKIYPAVMLILKKHKAGAKTLVGPKSIRIVG